MNMDKMIWKPEYSVGNEAIDTQHQKMIDMINQLTEIPSVQNFEGYISDVLNEMMDYYKVHFADEEMVWDECHYPDLEEHKKIHRSYIQQTAKFCMDSLRDPKQVDRRIHKYLSDWLNNHILETDMKYKPFINK